MNQSFSIPPEFKLRGAVEKAVLKAAAADLLPERIINRPKSGMLVPVQARFRQELKKYAEAMLLQKDSRIRPYIETRLIKEWLALRGNLLPPHGVKLWQSADGTSNPSTYARPSRSLMKSRIFNPTFTS